MIAHASFWVKIRRRKASDVAIVLGVCQRRGRLDVGIGGAGRGHRPWRPEAFLQYELGKTARSRDAITSRRDGAATILRRDERRGFPLRRVTEDGLEVLVAALVGAPVGVAKSFVD